MTSTKPSTSARWFVRGDIDGFLGLALDNLIQVLVILSLCTHVLGFSAEQVDKLAKLKAMLNKPAEG